MSVTTRIYKDARNGMLPLALISLNINMPTLSRVTVNNHPSIPNNVPFVLSSPT